MIYTDIKINAKVFHIQAMSDLKDIHIHILNIESRPAHGSQWKTALEAMECPFTVICRK